MKIVVKVGTSTLAHSSGKLNIRIVEKLCKVLSDLRNGGNDVILVSSGAIGMGIGKLGLKERPDDMPTKQAAAAVGQCELMYAYDKLFLEYGHTVAQVLLTGGDFENTERHNNLKATLSRLLSLGVIPVINENDTVSTAEISVGDNDTLAAIVAVSTGADILIILSDIDGLFTADPKTNKNAKLISEVEVVDERIYTIAGGAGSALGTGGMATKIKAAKLCTDSGVDMILLNGAHPENLYKVVDGQLVGTKFKGKI